MKIRFIDLFCGIGGFRVAANEAFKKFNIEPECVFSSDIDDFCRISYEENFGDAPKGDITKINPNNIPDHDLLFAGFPCQPFSIIGKGHGFEDARGTLFFEIAKILETKKPKAFVLENVKQLVGHNGGHTIRRIMETLEDLGYCANYEVFNALNYGLPQKRERVIIVGFDKKAKFSWPEEMAKYKPLSEIFEKIVDKKHLASDRIQQKRKNTHKSKHKVAIWHENKGGNVSSYPYSCALRANASYNYLLVNGKRRLTPREMLRLQGFPETYKIVVPDSQARKQAGNAVPVNVIQAVLESTVLPILTDSAIMPVVPKEPYKIYAEPKLA